MARLLDDNAHLVSYGAMSKEPLSLPTSLFIFKNLTCHGFWQTRWYGEKSLNERQELFDTLATLMRDGKVRAMMVLLYIYFTSDLASGP
jgi:mitochondrial enoyl-[acyl-carrier protein] reductase / trans-2-enoyl-CoA reductase